MGVSLWQKCEDTILEKKREFWTDPVIQAWLIRVHLLIEDEIRVCVNDLKIQDAWTLIPSALEYQASLSAE